MIFISNSEMYKCLPLNLDKEPLIVSSDTCFNNCCKAGDRATIAAEPYIYIHIYIYIYYNTYYIVHTET